MLLFLAGTGLGLVPAKTLASTRAVFTLAGLLTIVLLWRSAPNPKRILLPSCGIILASLIAESLWQATQHTVRACICRVVATMLRVRGLASVGYRSLGGVS